MYSYLISSSTVLGPRTKWFQDAGFRFTHFEIDIELGFESYFQDKRPIHLYLIFEKSSLKNQVRRTGFEISKLIFAGYTGSNNPVRNSRT